MECERCKNGLIPCWEFENTWWCDYCQLFFVGNEREYKEQVEKPLIEAVKEISGSYSKIYLECKKILEV